MIDEPCDIGWLSAAEKKKRKAQSAELHLI
jgi:hypothetical protein